MFLKMGKKEFFFCFFFAIFNGTHTWRTASFIILMIKVSQLEIL